MKSQNIIVTIQHTIDTQLATNKGLANSIMSSNKHKNIPHSIKRDPPIIINNPSEKVSHQQKHSSPEQPYRISWKGKHKDERWHKVKNR